MRSAGGLKLTLALALALACLAPGFAVAQPLTVSAAASLGDALRELGHDFEAAHARVTVRVNVAASGVLLQQIAQGAPVDVLASADAETVDSGVQRGLLLADGRHDFAANRVVLVVPALPAGSGPVATLADLARPEVQRIAIGKPATVPAGRYARQVLDAARLWPAVQRKVVPADSVRQVLDYVARGEVDAGFVYATDAATLPERVRVVLTAQGHAPVRYPAAVVAASLQPALAREFIAFLRSAPAQAVLARRGFLPP